jgi:hypothetical protein
VRFSGSVFENLGSMLRGAGLVRLHRAPAGKDAGGRMRGGCNYLTHLIKNFEMFLYCSDFHFSICNIQAARSSFNEMPC